MIGLGKRSFSIGILIIGSYLLILFFISIEQSFSNSRETLVFDRQELVSYAIQFLSDEELRKTGYLSDCSGFARAVYQKYGIELPRSSRDQFYTFAEPDTILMPGDLVYFKIRNQTISHVGIYVSDSTFIHSPGRNRYVCYEYLTAPYWKKYYAGYRNILAVQTTKNSINE